MLIADRSWHALRAAREAGICTDFGPEIGRSNVFQIGRAQDASGSRSSMPATIGGRSLLETNDGFGRL